MIHRLALIIGGVAAAAILALGFAATGFGPRAAPADAEQPTPGAAAGAAVVGTTDQAVVKPVTRVETTTVYVRPAAKPKVIHVTKRAPAAVARQAPSSKQTKVIHVTKVSGGGGDDGGGEQGDD